MIAVIGLYAVLSVSLTYFTDTMPSLIPLGKKARRSRDPPLPHEKRQACLSLIVSVAAVYLILRLLL